METNVISNEQTFPILDSKYLLLQTIGAGASCVVKLAKNLKSCELLAVKILKTIPKEKLKYLTNKTIYETETENLNKIKHKNIINMKEFGTGVIIKPSGQIKTVEYIILELATNGELFDYLYYPKIGLGEYYSRYIFSELLNAVEACHQKGIIHRDIKTENIMMHQNWELKLADFGFSTNSEDKNGSKILKTHFGTAHYAAPEVISKKPYKGEEADIFSLGVVLFVMVTAKLPFGRAAIFDNYYRNFIGGDIEKFWTQMNPKICTVSENFKELVSKILSFNANERPTISSIKNHDWFKEPTATPEEFQLEMIKRKQIVLNLKEIGKKQSQVEKPLEKMKRNTKIKEPEISNGLDFSKAKLDNEASIIDFKSKIKNDPENDI